MKMGERFVVAVEGGKSAAELELCVEVVGLAGDGVFEVGEGLFRAANGEERDAEVVVRGE